MKRVSILICALFLVLPSAGAKNAGPKPDPVLLKAEEKLRTALADVKPKPSFEYPKHTKSLVVKFRTRKFMIHGGSKNGRYNEKADEVEGPSYKGFRLRINLQEAGSVPQPCVPQTIREKYWKTDLNITVVEETDKQLYWALSYGSRVDPGHLKQIRRAINALGKTISGRQDTPDKK